MLVIHGGADEVVLHEDILDLCKEHPKAELCVIPGTDHRFKKRGK